jgi:FAD/FMN-containing dehydrogenases
LRYGNARELCLGLEVVTAQGEVLDALNLLRKNNTGYSLRDLYVGAEGTLGIITAAALKLFAQPAAQSPHWWPCTTWLLPLACSAWHRPGWGAA